MLFTSDGAKRLFAQQVLHGIQHRVVVQAASVQLEIVLLDAQVAGSPEAIGHRLGVEAVAQECAVEVRRPVRNRRGTHIATGGPP